MTMMYVEPVRVVVVDDSPRIRMLATLGLDETDGVTVVGVAADGQEALAVIEESRPDVVVLDVAMPVMDGYATLMELQTRHPQIPVVMFSGHSEEGVEARAHSLGAAAFVEKSGDLSRLAAAIRRVATSRPLA